jgi:NAD(P)-dependent dehydrogenase (short-subunit alcohol dehydrogenase family)
MSNPSSESALPVCVITGGSSGIGLATARLMRRSGYRIAICGRGAEQLSAAHEELVAIKQDNPREPQNDGDQNVLAVQVDLDDAQQATEFIERAIEEFGTVDVFVNNAAMAPLEKFEDISADTFESLVNVNVRAGFYLTQRVWQQMIKSAGGTIINISSMAAVDPFPGFNLYGASKAWMDLLTQALAGEGESHDIRICSIRPGAVETPLLRRLFPDFPSDQCVSPERIAQMVLDCVRDPHDYRSGQFFPVTNQPETTV